MPSPVHTGKDAHLGSENRHTVGKRTGLLCWLVISLGPTNQPLKFILEKQVFISWFYLAYGLGKSGAEPWKQTGLYQTGKCLFPGMYRRESSMQKYTVITIHPQLYQDLLQQDCILWTWGKTHTPRFINFFSQQLLKVFSVLGNLLISEDWSIISYQLFSIWLVAQSQIQLKRQPWEGQLLSGENENKNQNSRLWPFISFIVWSRFPSRALPNLEVVLQKSVSDPYKCFRSQNNKTVRADEVRGPEL